MIHSEAFESSITAIPSGPLTVIWFFSRCNRQAFMIFSEKEITKIFLF
ncbi:hypothetical protein B932_1178 [Gluconobacter oxydans H24]|nr:hypothetical protein B932_1178 [Gluconobacter oxydans H24]